MSNIEVHVTHACNLTCDSCSHYSNHGHKQLFTSEDLKQWMLPWSKKIQPKWISLMGGEPTLNKNLSEIVETTADMWLNSQIRVITNGFFLDRHPDLPATLVKTKSQLRISIHYKSEEYDAHTEKIKEIVKGWKLKHPTLNVIWKEDFKNWLRVYKGYGNSMMPYEDENPKESWNNCGVKFCRQIFLGKLWKCPNLAYLQLQDKKFKLNEVWDKYLTYRVGDLTGQAIEPTASLREIRKFYEEKEISHCAMCPANGMKNLHEKLPNPLIPVSNLLK